MNDDKFATFGEKLNVKTEDLPGNSPSIWVKKAGFFLVQGLVLAISSLAGLLLGFTEHSYQSAYPFFSMSGMIGGVGLIGMSTANWKKTAARDSEVGGSLKRWVKIPLVLVNTILSVAAFLLTFGVTASSDQLTAHMLYGVHSEKEE